MVCVVGGSSIDTNLKSVFLVSKVALPHLKAARGVIVNMGSMVGLMGLVGSEVGLVGSVVCLVVVLSELDGGFGGLCRLSDGFVGSVVREGESIVYPSALPKLYGPRFGRRRQVAKCERCLTPPRTQRLLGSPG